MSRLLVSHESKISSSESRTNFANSNHQTSSPSHSTNSWPRICSKRAVEVGVIYQLYGPKLSVFRLLFAFTKSRDFKTERERMLGDIDKCQQLTTLFAYEVSTEITEKRTCWVFYFWKKFSFV